MLLRAAVLSLGLASAGAQAEAPLHSPAASGAAPWLGMNLTSLRDYQPQRPVIDVMKNARDWFGILPGQFSGVTGDELRAKGVFNAQGWPVRVPDGLEGISTVMLVDMPEQATGLAGNYRLRHAGSGRLQIHGRIDGQRRRGRGEIWFAYTPGPGVVQVTIRQTDPDDPIRDIEIVHERHIDAYEDGAIFNPDWLARIEGLAVMRFMDFMDTNFSTLRHWQDRPRPSDPVWTRKGVPLEGLIRLANKTGIEPWFTIPHKADDEFMTRMAEMIRDTLDPDLRAWIEFSNETWNWIFSQAHHAGEAAEARWGDSSLWQEWNAMRAAQMVQIFDEVFAGEGERLHRVLSTQTNWKGLEQQLEARHWQAEDPANPAPPTLFDAYGITGYFSANLGLEPKAEQTLQWLENARAEAAQTAEARGLSGEEQAAFIRDESHATLIPKLIEELRDGRHSGDRTATLAHLLDVALPYHQEVAARWGLEVVAYEAGTHLVGVGPMMDDARLTDLFIATNFSEGMAALYTELLEGWHAAGADVFAHFADISSPGAHGSWGALRHLDDHNPRWQALVGFNPEEAAP